MAGALKLTGVATGVERLRDGDELEAMHTCGITAEGRIYCWGRNRYGQLGTGKTGDAEFRSLVSVQALMPS